MRYGILPAVAALLMPCVAFAQDASPKPPFPPYVHEWTQLRPFHSDETGRDYMLYVAYPWTYAQQPDRKYPVVYLTDAYWAFAGVSTLCTGLWSDALAPEYILIGIGYKNLAADNASERFYELTPTSSDMGRMAGVKGEMGGSRKFLNAIKNEIIPYVEANFQADPHKRILVGSSLGGLFSLYAMYEEPGLFSGVVAASPSLQWDDDWIVKREAELRGNAAGSDGKGRLHIPTRLYMSVGGDEIPMFVDKVKGFEKTLQNAGYTDFSLQFRVCDGLKHTSSFLESFNHGLIFVLGDSKE
jgi:uncharacterized protein